MTGPRGLLTKGTLCLLLVLFGLAGTARWWGRVFFPYPYRSIVEAESRKYGLDPLLVLALIREESSFNPEAVSRRGALGLMQVMPQTGSWIAAQLRESYTPERLLAPAENIHFGSWYLASLLAEFEGDPVKALIAYNAGGSRVRTWLAERVWDGTLASLGKLPYGETRQYVVKIMRTYRIYRYLYRGV